MYKSLDPSVIKASSSLLVKNDPRQQKKKGVDQFSALANLKSRTVGLRSSFSYSTLSHSRIQENYQSIVDETMEQARSKDLETTKCSKEGIGKLIDCSYEEKVAGELNDYSKTGSQIPHNIFLSNKIVDNTSMDQQLMTKPLQDANYGKIVQESESENLPEESPNSKHCPTNIYLQNVVSNHKQNSGIKPHSTKKAVFEQTGRSYDPKNVKTSSDIYESYLSCKSVNSLPTSNANMRANSKTTSLGVSTTAVDINKTDTLNIDSLVSQPKGAIRDLPVKQDSEPSLEKMSDIIKKDVCAQSDVDTDVSFSQNSVMNSDNENELNDYMDLVDHFSDNGYAEPVYKPDEKRFKLKFSVKETQGRTESKKMQSELLKYEFIFDTKDYDKYSNFSYTEDLDPEYLSRHNVTFKKTSKCPKLSISGKKVIVLDIIDKNNMPDSSPRSITTLHSDIVKVELAEKIKVKSCGELKVQKNINESRSIQLLEEIHSNREVTTNLFDSSTLIKADSICLVDGKNNCEDSGLENAIPVVSKKVVDQLQGFSVKFSYAKARLMQETPKTPQIPLGEISSTVQPVEISRTRQPSASQHAQESKNQKEYASSNLKLRKPKVDKNSNHQEPLAKKVNSSLTLSKVASGSDKINSAMLTSFAYFILSYGCAALPSFKNYYISQSFTKSTSALKPQSKNQSSVFRYTESSFRRTSMTCIPSLRKMLRSSSNVSTFQDTDFEMRHKPENLHALIQTSTKMKSQDSFTIYQQKF